MKSVFITRKQKKRRNNACYTNMFHKILFIGVKGWSFVSLKNKESPIG